MGEISQWLNWTLCFIVKKFEYKSRDILVSLYKSIVRHQHKYASKFWS